MVILTSVFLCVHVLTVPVLPRDRWLSCWVRGPIIEVGWMDMAWSIVGVRTVPCWIWHTVSQAVMPYWEGCVKACVCVTTYSWLHEVWLMGHPGRAVYLHSAVKTLKSVSVVAYLTLVWTAAYFLGFLWEKCVREKVLTKDYPNTGNLKPRGQTWLTFLFQLAKLEEIILTSKLNVVLFHPFFIILLSIIYTSV